MGGTQFGSTTWRSGPGSRTAFETGAINWPAWEIRALAAAPDGTLWIGAATAEDCANWSLAPDP